MSLTLCMPDAADLKPRIVVMGIGGAGGNAVNNMITKNLEGVEFVVANTDAQALQLSMASHKVQLGEKLTEGLGAGASPDVGAAAARESIEAVKDHLGGCHMCFVTAGLGGGTGTGAAPVVSEVARELGVLTVGVVTKPFDFEGIRRMRYADDGLLAIKDKVDTLIVIPNQNLFRVANEKTTITDAFAMADEVLYQGVKGVTDLMVKPGIINLDFSDIRSVMSEMGQAMMGTGECSGEGRAIKAAESAISNPLLDEVSFRGARGVLINITGGPDMTLFEVDEAANRIRQELDPDETDANIIVGSTQDPAMEGTIKISVVATGIDKPPGANTARQPEFGFETDFEPAGNAHHGEGNGSSNGAYWDDGRTHVEQDLPVAQGAFVYGNGAEQDETRLSREGELHEGDPGQVNAREQEAAGQEVMNPGWHEQNHPAALADDPLSTGAAETGHGTDGTDEFDRALPSPAYRSRATGMTSGIMHAEESGTEQVSRAGERNADPAFETAPRHHDTATELGESGQEWDGAQQVTDKGAEQGRNGGFGLNNLISKMTGRSASSQSGRREPAVTSNLRRRDEYGDERVSEFEQNEIPAFLRRQAN